jgi:hypothetical protein
MCRPNFAVRRVALRTVPPTRSIAFFLLALPRWGSKRNPRAAPATEPAANSVTFWRRAFRRRAAGIIPESLRRTFRTRLIRMSRSIPITS